MNELSENPPVDEKQTLLATAKADFKQAKEAVKTARKAASQAKETLQALKADLKKSSTKKSKKSS